MSRERFLGLGGYGLVLIGLTGFGLHLQRRNALVGFVAVALAQGAVYLLALRFARPAVAPRHSVLLILAIAATLRLIVIAAPPYLSTDVYRYVWDGRVIAAGINPYRYIPNDPHLAALRDRDIFPRINRNTYAPTIYPPAAEALFFVVTRVSESVAAMKAAMVACEAIAIILLLRLLAVAGLPPARIIVYAWHPLPLWEFAGSGHIDAAIIALVVSALWYARTRNPEPKNGSGLGASRRPGRTQEDARSGGCLTGLALAGGALVKFYPVVLLPALWRRWDWRLPAVFAATVVLAYAPFLGVGARVFGFLAGYLSEEGFTTAGGAGFYLWSVIKSVLSLGAVPDLAYIAGAGCVMAALALRVASGSVGVVGGAALLGTAFTVLLSPHYPWYFAWLLVFACLVPSASLLWLTLASFLLYLVPVGSQLVWDRPRFFVESALYVPFLVLAAIDLRRYPRRAAQEQPRHGDNAG